MQCVEVQFYGNLAELLGRRILVSAEASWSVADLRDAIAARHPHASAALKDRRVRAFINHEFAADDQPLRDHEQVEFLPVVSGG